MAAYAGRSLRDLFVIVAAVRGLRAGGVAVGDSLGFSMLGGSWIVLLPM